MLRSVHRFINWFIPHAMRGTDSDHMMLRTFVALHLAGPLMGQSVTFFLSRTSAGGSWQLWVLEAMVLAFLAIPFVLRATASLAIAAGLSVQMIVGMSLFGSFFFGGIASPLLPWFLIAMALGFFYLADAIARMLVGVAVQLATFFAARVIYGAFPTLLDPKGLYLANTFSIISALVYMTLLMLYYERVMRISLHLEQETIEQRTNLALLREAMEAAERASKRKSIFLAKMSHELRTPLNAVIGYADILRENFEERPEAHRKMEDLDRIHAAGRHLLALVNNTIDLSAIEANRQELTTEPILVAGLIDEVVATASPLIAKRDNRMVVELQDELGTLDLDALKVRQSILNLLSNAAKFTTKGTIMLTVGRRAQAGGDRLLIEVADNGIGMTPEGVGRIFSNFGQAENDTVSHYGGTGLGLALTQQFCEMMGGTISVRSERGVGTSFSIDIPIVEQPIAGQADVEQPDDAPVATPRRHAA
ncbi:ATP-binding protein [uncultured Sphingomonas sp.]|uniref:sensor histidine kinase n=1 Tax=uncultured Sphingomonas sp. TaxID=158754 RepID=UPI0025F00259|nr:ATP-binding protein [uncultured Sphingomonas sp.]